MMTNYTNYDTIFSNSDLSDKEKSDEFFKDLQKFHLSLGKEQIKIPCMAGKDLDFYKLFREVVTRGGFSKVLENKQWKDVVSILDIHPSCTSASFLSKKSLSKNLLSYEQQYLKSKNSVNTDLLLVEKNEKDKKVNNNNIITNNPSSLNEQNYLNKKVLQSTTNSELNFIFRPIKVNWQGNKEKVSYKKINITNTTPDLKRVVLAFESHNNNEILWALNVMSLFSSNTNIQFSIENQPYLIESMTQYMIYCINNISDLNSLLNDLPINTTPLSTNNTTENNNIVKKPDNSELELKEKDKIEVNQIIILVLII